MSNSVPSQPTWTVYDSTKVSAFSGCRRKYFYEFVLGWRNDSPSNHLIFGDSWHNGMENLYLLGYSTENILRSWEIFCQTYRKEFDESTDEMFKGKTPEGALNAYTQFCVDYGDDPSQHNVLYTEISGSVPIALDPERRIHFRLDAVLERRSDSMIICDEHKTTGMNLSDIWSNQFELSIQVGTYTHAAYCIYPRDRVKGVRINGTQFKRLKTDPIFRSENRRVPCWRTFPQMETWLFTVNDIIDDIEMEHERLESSSESDSVLAAFPLTGHKETCTEYFSICPYLDLCTAWANPLRHCHEPPIGMKSEFWDPREKDSSHKMELEWKEG